MQLEAPVFSEATVIWLDVHARGVRAAAIDMVAAEAPRDNLRRVGDSEQQSRHRAGSMQREERISESTVSSRPRAATLDLRQA